MSTITLGQAVDLYLADKAATGRCGPRTLKVQRGALLTLVTSPAIAAKGGPATPLGAVTRADARAFRDALYASGTRKPSYVNAILGAASSLYAWAGRELELADSAGIGNPFGGRGLAMVDPVQPGDRRAPFTDADLMCIWPAVTAQIDLGRRFVPELVLRLGVRPEEAAQVNLRDLRVVCGIPTVTIQAGAGQSIKNPGSRRTLPLDLGGQPALRAFWAWAHAKNSADGEGFLFPAGAEGGRRATRISRWFTDVALRSRGIDDPKKVLYSLRHTFATRLAQAGVGHEGIGDLMGHARTTLAGRVYCAEQTVPAAFEILSKKLRLPV